MKLVLILWAVATAAAQQQAPSFRAESRLVNLFTAFEDGNTYDTVPALTDLVATDYGMDL